MRIFVSEFTDSGIRLISLSHKDLSKALEDEAFYSHIISLSVDGAVEKVVLKDLQRHPSKATLLHADFQRIAAGIVGPGVACIQAGVRRRFDIHG